MCSDLCSDLCKNTDGGISSCELLLYFQLFFSSILQICFIIMYSTTVPSIVEEGQNWRLVYISRFTLCQDSNYLVCFNSNGWDMNLGKSLLSKYLNIYLLAKFSGNLLLELFPENISPKDQTTHSLLTIIPMVTWHFLYCYCYKSILNLCMCLCMCLSMEKIMEIGCFSQINQILSTFFIKYEVELQDKSLLL